MMDERPRVSLVKPGREEPPADVGCSDSGGFDTSLRCITPEHIKEECYPDGTPLSAGAPRVASVPCVPELSEQCTKGTVTKGMREITPVHVKQ